MKKTLITLLVAFGWIAAAPAALLLQYTFNNTDAVSGVAANVTASGTISRVGLGSAVYATDAPTSGAFEGSHYLGTPASALNNAILTKPDTNVSDTLQTHYVEFTITPDSGYSVNLNHLDVILLGGSAVGAYLNTTLFAELQYRVGSGSFVSAGSVSSDIGAGHTRLASDRNFSLGLASISEAVTFRLFINDQSGGGPFVVGIDNIRLDGSVAAIPEPSTYALLLGGVAALFGLRRIARKA